MMSLFQKLAEVFADKCIVEDRTPLVTFGLPGVEGTFALLAPKAAFWQQTILVSRYRSRLGFLLLRQTLSHGGVGVRALSNSFHSSSLLPVVFFGNLHSHSSPHFSCYLLFHCETERNYLVLLAWIWSHYSPCISRGLLVVRTPRHPQ